METTICRTSMWNLPPPWMPWSHLTESQKLISDRLAAMISCHLRTMYLSRHPTVLTVASRDTSLSRPRKHPWTVENLKQRKLDRTKPMDRRSLSLRVVACTWCRAAGASRAGSMSRWIHQISGSSTLLTGSMDKVFTRATLLLRPKRRCLTSLAATLPRSSREGG